MPSGIFPVPKFRPVPARARPSPVVRIRTRVRRNILDWQLAHGADPGENAELALRAGQLRSAPSAPGSPMRSRRPWETLAGPNR